MITVNGTRITDDEIAREAQYHPAESREAALREASRALVVRALLLQEAAARGITASQTVDGASGGADNVGATGASDGAAAGDADAVADTEERIIAALLDSEISLPVADENECRRFFDAHLDRFRSPDLFEASHILFAAPVDDPAERERARLAAESTLAEIRRDPASFDRLARERSADNESREQGGHIGQITRGQTPPEFEACLDSLSPGDVCSEPVCTRYGYHVIRLDRLARGRPLTFEMAWEKVAEYLGASAWTRAVHQYIQLLIGRATIDGIELDGAATPLVQ